MAKVSLAKFGEISPPILNKILDLMDECYRLLGEPIGGSVDLEIFEKSGAETFFATHDALEGKPRIRVYLDKLLALPESVALAGLRRQVAHSILHGSLKFYLVRFPEHLKRVVTRYKLPYEFGNSLLYGTAMAAKEYEVTELLYKRNFVNDQIAYAKYILEPTSEDVLTWGIVLKNKLEKILHLAAIVRDISCAVPLAYDKIFGDEIKESIRRRIAHISPEYQARIQKIIYKKFPLLGTDTFENIDLVTEWVIEEIVARKSFY